MNSALMGTDVTILKIVPTLYTVIEAADILREKHGISAEVIDARSLVPFNFEKVRNFTETEQLRKRAVGI